MYLVLLLLTKMSDLNAEKVDVHLRTSVIALKEQAVVSTSLKLSAASSFLAGGLPVESPHGFW